MSPSHYVIRRVRDDHFVARAGQNHSYTDNLRYAQVWKTREEAEIHCCDNEYIMSVYHVLSSW